MVEGHRFVVMGSGARDLAGSIPAFNGAHAIWKRCVKWPRGAPKATPALGIMAAAPHLRCSPSTLPVHDDCCDDSSPVRRHEPLGSIGIAF